MESIPLIAGSIMSKKIAEGTESLVLDVKVGTGAFMTERERAAELARTMVRLGRDHGLKVTAVLSAMDTPLGGAVGNALEVTESVEVLEGKHSGSDLVELTLALAREMLELPASMPILPRRSETGGLLPVIGRWSLPKEVTPTPACPGRLRSSSWADRAGVVVGWTPVPSGWPPGDLAPVGPARRIL